MGFPRRPHRPGEAWAPDGPVAMPRRSILLAAHPILLALFWLPPHTPTPCAGDEGIKFRGTPRPAASDKLHEIKTLDELLSVLRLTLCPPGVAWRGQEIYASDYASPRPPAAKTSTTTAPLPPPTPAIVTPCVTGGRWAARARARAARTGPRACRLARRTRSRAACTWFGFGFGFGFGLGLP